jgi:hypothetical protein
MTGLSRVRAPRVVFHLTLDGVCTPCGSNMAPFTLTPDAATAVNPHDVCPECRETAKKTAPNTRVA